MISLTQLVIAISIPTFVALLGVLWNTSITNKLSEKIDRQTENFNNQVTTLLTTIHGVDVRVVRLEERQKP